MPTQSDSYVRDIEKISRNLLARSGTKVYDLTILYIVYKTIEGNPNITVNKLSHFLQQEYMIKPNVVESAVGSLSSKTLLGSVTRFQRQGSPVEQAHLHVKPESEIPVTFTEWLSTTLQEFPELAAFVAPVYPVKQKQ